MISSWYSVHRDLAWGLEGCPESIMDQETSEMPLSKALNPGPLLAASYGAAPCRPQNNNDLNIIKHIIDCQCQKHRNTSDCTNVPIKVERVWIMRFYP